MRYINQTTVYWSNPFIYPHKKKNQDCEDLQSSLVCLFLFVWGLSSHSKFFNLVIWRRHHYRWRAAHFDLCAALMAIEQWGFTNCDMGHPFIMVRDTHTYCRAFSSGAVTTCFYNMIIFTTLMLLISIATQVPLRGQSCLHHNVPDFHYTKINVV